MHLLKKLLAVTLTFLAVAFAAQDAHAAASAFRKLTTRTSSSKVSVTFGEVELRGMRGHDVLVLLVAARHERPLRRRGTRQNLPLAPL